MAKGINEWFKDEGDSTHRVDYPLNTDSIVIDAGCYKGGWAAHVYSIFKCNIHAFEPVKSFYDICIKNLAEQEKIKVYHKGLSSSSKDEIIYLKDDMSSVFSKEGKEERIELIDIFQFLNEQKIDMIDLLKLNIEGGEYEILEHILKQGKSNMFKNIQIQFHKVVNNSVERRRKIQKELSKTHKLTYNYEFVWENWELKG